MICNWIKARIRHHALPAKLDINILFVLLASRKGLLGKEWTGRLGESAGEGWCE
jgi:hypothetical protein